VCTQRPRSVSMYWEAMVMSPNLPVS
jgi:hypothetical protein